MMMHNEEVFCIILNRNKLGYWMAIRIIGCILYFFSLFFYYFSIDTKTAKTHTYSMLFIMHFPFTVTLLPLPGAHAL